MEPFNDVAITYHALMFLAAGEETSAASQSIALYYLARHPDLQDRAARECSQVRPEEVSSLEELLAAMPFTYACFNEALRL